MTLSDILQNEELCMWICNELDPDWRAHYLADPIIGVQEMARYFPETVMETAREYD